MSIERVKKFFADIGEPERVIEFEQSTATSELAAQALNCEVGRIAKTISVFVDKKPALILISGDMKIDNKRYVKCLCECGKICIVSRNDVITGHTQSCGCLWKERFVNSHSKD